MPTTTGYIPIEGGRLFYETTGDPSHPAFVMIHAGVADHRMWQPQVDAFSHRFYCVTYDVRGFGKTESENGRFNNRRDLMALLDHLKIDRAILMGCSRGGQISGDFTIENPSRVRALILVGSGLTGYFEDVSTAEEIALFEEMEAAANASDWDKVEALELRAWYQGVTRSVDQVDPAYLAKGAQMLRDGRIHSLKHGMNGLEFVPIEPPTAQRLNEFKIPVLILCGDADMTDAKAVAQVMYKGIAGSEVVIMPNSTHLPGLEKPDEFNHHIGAFLDRVTG